MRHECWARGQTLSASKGFSQSELIKCFQKLRNLLFSAFDSETNHASKASHLFFGNLMVLVVLEAWVDGAFHALVLVEKMSNVICVFG